MRNNTAKYPALAILLNKLTEMESLNRPFSVNIIADMGPEGLHEAAIQKKTSAEVETGFEKTLKFNPERIIIQEFKSRNPQRNSTPEKETVIVINHSTHQQNQPQDTQAALGTIGDETLSVDAMVERIRNLNDKLAEERQKREELEQYLEELPEEEKPQGLAGMVEKLLGNEQNLAMLGSLVSMFSGNGAAAHAQLAGHTPQNNVQSQVTPDGATPAHNQEAIVNINKYLGTLDADTFNKVYEVFFYISSSPDNLQTVYDLVKQN